MGASEHFIPGKDASLEASIQTLQAALRQRGFTLEERSWLNPVAGCWSVHVRDADCPMLFANGKGASELAARASALGEFVERLSCRHFWTHYHLGNTLAEASYVFASDERWFPLPRNGKWPAGLLNPELRAFYDPEQMLSPAGLVEFNTGHATRGLCALPFVHQRDGKTVWFPVNLIGNLYLSNGLAAGNTPAEARVQAMSEILERHVKFKVLREGLCLPDVPAEVLARYPLVVAGLQALRDAGFAIQVRDGSLGGQFPVLVVVLMNPRDQGCYASFGAHPRFEVALERALTELLQGRGLDALTGFPPPSFELDEVSDAQNLESHFVDSTGLIGWPFFGTQADHPFVDWDFGGTTQQEFDGLLGAIEGAGHEVYIQDCTPLGIYACRIVVPGMSEVYPVEDLAWENNNRINAIRPALLRLPQLTPDECAALRDAMDELELADDRVVASLIGLAADADSAWQGLRVGELRALLALRSGDADEAAEGCAWVQHFGQLDPARRLLYAALEALLRLPEAHYLTALSALYGDETLQQAQQIVCGETPFPGLALLGADMEGSARHQSLLAAYRKLF